MDEQYELLQYYRDFYDGYYDVGGTDPKDDFEFMRMLQNKNKFAMQDFTDEFIGSLAAEKPVIPEKVTADYTGGLAQDLFGEQKGLGNALSDGLDARNNLNMPEGTGGYLGLGKYLYKMGVEQAGSLAKGFVSSSLQKWLNPKTEIQHLEHRLAEYNTALNNVTDTTTVSEIADPTEKMFFALYMDQMDANSPFSNSVITPPAGMTKEQYARQRAKEDVHGWQGHTRWVEGPRAGYDDFTGTDSLKLRYYENKVHDEKSKKTNQFLEAQELAFDMGLPGIDAPDLSKTPKDQLEAGIEALTVRLAEAKALHEMPTNQFLQMKKDLHEDVSKWNAEVRKEIHDHIEIARSEDPELERLALWAEHEPSEFLWGRHPNKGIFMGLPDSDIGFTTNVLNPAIALRDIGHAATTVATLYLPGTSVRAVSKLPKLAKLATAGKYVDKGMQAYLFSLEGGSIQSKLYNELINEGYSEDEANDLSVAAGFYYAPLAYVMEKLGADTVSKFMGIGEIGEEAVKRGMIKNVKDNFIKSGFKNIGGYLKHIGTGGVTEMYTEGYQAFWEKIVSEAMAQGYGDDRETARINLFAEIRNNLGENALTYDYAITAALPLLSPMDDVRHQAVAGGVGGAGLSGLMGPTSGLRKKFSVGNEGGVIVTRDDKGNAVNMETVPEGTDGNSIIANSEGASNTNFKFDLEAFNTETYVKTLANQIIRTSDPIKNKDIVSQNDEAIAKGQKSIDPDLLKIIKAGQKKEGDFSAKLINLVKHLRKTGVEDVGAWIDNIKGLDSKIKDKIKFRIRQAAKDLLLDPVRKELGIDDSAQENQISDYLDSKSYNSVVNNAMDDQSFDHYLHHAYQQSESGLSHMDDKDFDASKIFENDSDIQKNRNAVPYKAILDFNAKVVQVARNKIAGVNFSNITADHVKDKLFPYLIVNTYENGSETTKAMLDKLPESTLQSIADGIVGIDTSQGLKESILSEIENLVLPEHQRSTEIFTPEMKEAVEETIDVSDENLYDERYLVHNIKDENKVSYKELALVDPNNVSRETMDLVEAEMKRRLAQKEYRVYYDKNDPEAFTTQMGDSVEEAVAKSGVDPGSVWRMRMRNEEYGDSFDITSLPNIDAMGLLEQERKAEQKDEFDFDDDSDIPNDVLMGSFNKLGLKPEEIQSAIDAQDAQFESQNLRDPNLTKDITDDTVDETNPCGIDVSTIDKDMGEF